MFFFFQSYFLFDQNVQNPFLVKYFTARKKRGYDPRFRLLTQIQFSNDRTITLDIFFIQIAQKAATVTDHFQKTASRVMILFVFLEMFRQISDTRVRTAICTSGDPVSPSWTAYCLMSAVFSSCVSIFFPPLWINYPVAKGSVGVLRCLCGGWRLWHEKYYSTPPIYCK